MIGMVRFEKEDRERACPVMLHPPPAAVAAAVPGKLRLHRWACTAGSKEGRVWVGWIYQYLERKAEVRRNGFASCARVQKGVQYWQQQQTGSTLRCSTLRCGFGGSSNRQAVSGIAA
eukprot:1100409-Pelagomonas_calceolata.AAC.4